MGDDTGGSTCIGRTWIHVNSKAAHQCFFSHNSSKGCKAGDGCRFAHDSMAGSSQHEEINPRLKTCRYYANGYCSRSNCMFVHDDRHTTGKTAAQHVRQHSQGETSGDAPRPEGPYEKPLSGAQTRKRAYLKQQGMPFDYESIIAATGRWPVPGEDGNSGSRLKAQGSRRHRV